MEVILLIIYSYTFMQNENIIENRNKIILFAYKLYRYFPYIIISRFVRKIIITNSRSFNEIAFLNDSVGNKFILIKVHINV